MCPKRSVGAGWGAGVARGHWVGLYPHGGAGARGEGHGGAAVIVQVHHGMGAGDEAVEGWPRLPLSETLDVALHEKGAEGEQALLPARSVPSPPIPPHPILSQPIPSHPCRRKSRPRPGEISTLGAGLTGESTSPSKRRTGLGLRR